MKEFKVMYKRKATFGRNGWAYDKNGEEHWFNISAPNGMPITRKPKTRESAESLMAANKKAWAERQANPDGYSRSNNPPTEWRIMVREVSEWEVDE